MDKAQRIFERIKDKTRLEFTLADFKDYMFESFKEKRTIKRNFTVSLLPFSACSGNYGGEKLSLSAVRPSVGYFNFAIIKQASASPSANICSSTTGRTTDECCQTNAESLIIAKKNSENLFFGVICS